MQANGSKRTLTGLMLGALGVVYGDIGTSPLYAISEAVVGARGTHDLGAARSTLLAMGLASTVFWALFIVVTWKYVTWVIRADQEGEGGIFALLGLLKTHSQRVGVKRLGIYTVLVAIGAAMLYGEGTITPAISVLSAVEGLRIATPFFQPFVVPITVAILGVLFYVQHKGTDAIGKVFGPIMFLWFVSIALVGLPWIARHPEVLGALHPQHAWNFIQSLSFRQYIGFMGGVTLCITGGEALYADLGHFNRKSIALSWMFVVFPALTINYLGQAARLLEPGVIPHGNVFFSLVPKPFLIPMVILAMLSTVIASQALISGAFSLTRQAIQLGLFPRFRIVYTSDEKGQIYIPKINLMLCVGSIALVLAFRTSSSLAGAYGLAVAGTMLITSLTYFGVRVFVWKREVVLSLLLCGAFALVDLNFLFANVAKLVHGGWVPLLIAILVATPMLTWRWGRRQLRDATKNSKTKDVGWLIAKRREIRQGGGAIRDHRGTFPMSERVLVFLSSVPIRSHADSIGILTRYYLKRHASMPKRIFFLHIQQVDVPHVIQTETMLPEERPYQVIDLGEGVTSIIVRYGYAQRAHFGVILRELMREYARTDIPPHHWLIVAGRDDIQISKNLGYVHRFFLGLFAFLLRASTPAHHYFGLGVRRDLMPDEHWDHLDRIINAALESNTTDEPLNVKFGRRGAHYRFPDVDRTSPEEAAVA